MKSLVTMYLFGMCGLLLAQKPDGPPTAHSVRNRFIGVWKLVSCERKSSSGELSYPYGEKPVGRITYDKAGRMSAQLMRPERRSPAGAILHTDSPTELRDVLGFVAYFGTFDIDEGTRTVIHHVQASLVPGYVVTDLKRTYEFAENQLILTARTEGAAVRLIWECEPD
jgi:hypothetical protein